MQPMSSTKMPSTTQHFDISIPNDAIKLLKQRLSLARLPSQFEATAGDDWAFGVPAKELERLVTYWKDTFDWRKAEQGLNELPNFKTDIDVDGFGTLDIHFVHQISPVKNAIPLLFCHGWPGSFLEVKKLLPLLKGGDSLPAFHVVAPSLPNFGFSSGVNKKGFGLDQHAETLHKLMIKLGYTTYVTQGGDAGWSILRAVGLLYPESCKASHFNMNLALPPQWLRSPLLALKHAITPYTDREKRGLERSQRFERQGFGYYLLQSTKPQTVGSVLSDSPVALLAWMYEKLHDWTEDYKWTDDEILTWVSIYWFSTAGPEASVRIYHDGMNPEPQSKATVQALRGYVPHVKLGIAHFPGELSGVPAIWAATLGPVVLQKEHAKGGHFAAWEVPEAIVADLQVMFETGGPCFGVIPGRTGY